MIRAVLLDDDKAELERIKTAVREYATTIQYPLSVKAFSDALQLFEEIDASGGFDIYILDILMPVFSGIEVAARLRERGERSEIIFLTSSREYGAEAFGVEATGYLLKPVAFPELKALLDKTITKLSRSDGVPLNIKTKDGYFRVIPSDIMQIESFNHYREVTLIGGKKIKTPTTLREFKEMLKNESRFRSPHRAYLINMEFVAGFRGRELLMRGLPSVPVAKSIQADFKESYLEYFFKKR